MILAYIHRSQPELLPEDEASTQSERNAKADQIMTELVASDPDVPEIRLANFEYLRRYNLAGVDEELNKALELGPEVLAVRLAVAAHLRRKGERLLESRTIGFAEGGGAAISDQEPEEMFAQAREHLEHILESINPNSESAHVAMGDVYTREGRIDDAKIAWNNGLNSVGETSLSLNMRMAEALAREDDPKTKQYLKRLDIAVRARSSSVSLDVKNSLTRTRNLIEACERLDEIRERPNRTPPLWDGQASARIAEMIHERFVQNEQ